MKTQIVVHLLPHEIDWFEWQSKQLKIGSKYLNTNDSIIIDVTLNLNLIDWSSSLIPKDFFIKKFKDIEKLYDWSENKFIIDDYGVCMGCNDKRMSSVIESLSDNIIYLDSDLIFPPEILYYITSAAKNINSEYYIISPQTIRIWDSSWDIITNSKYITSTQPSLESYLNNDPYRTISDTSSDINLLKIDSFKFGGGWFNLLSTNLLKFTGVPVEFSPYGPDDTYVMVCAEYMKMHGYDVNQYVLNGMIVNENNKYRYNPYKDFLNSLYDKSDFRDNSHSNFNTAIQKFIKKL